MKVDDTDRARPYAYADPRSLSQAWYDALYGPRAPHKHATPEATRPAASATETVTEPAAEFESHLSQVRANLDVPQRARAADGAAEIEPDESPSTPARRRLKTARGSDAPQTETAERSDVEIDDGHGGLKLLVSQRGGEIEVVAICEREARERTADALARARIALGARGIAVTTTLRDKHEGEAL